MGWVLYSGAETSKPPAKHLRKILAHDDACLKGFVGNAMHLQAIGHALLFLLAGTVLDASMPSQLLDSEQHVDASMPSQLLGSEQHVDASVPSQLLGSEQHVDASKPAAIA